MKMKSLYVHIPFCKQKCLYCDFNSYSGKENLIDKYVEALKKEISNYKIRDYNTIYFGGGTPSIILEKYIKEILDMLETEDREITLELNPGTIDENKLRAYKEAGVNRLSIGLQATQNSILKEIGRIHTFEEFDEAYNLVRKCGFKNINVDLMFGLPNQTLKDVNESLDYLIKINPEHISCYSLILHNNIFKNLPTDEEEREMYHTIVKRLKEAGYTHYEISNFAKQNMESKHNLCYWNQQEYVGVGAGASSYIDGKRYTNELNIEKYIEKINNNMVQYEVEEEQDEESKLREYIILKTRLIEGLGIEDTNKKFNVDLMKKFENEINKLKNLGLIETIQNTKIKLTDKGLDLANIVWEEFI